MNLRLIKTIGLFCLAFSLAGGVFAQKNKIKNRPKPAQSDSTKVDVPPKPSGGKSSIKDRVVVLDSAQKVIADSLKALASSNIVPGDSSTLLPGDSARKPKKRFYTRVKENDLTQGESRAENLRLRIAIAEERLEEYQSESTSDESIKFTKEELEQFAASIELAKTKLNLADSSLLAVRTKLDDEGRLNLESTEPEGAEDEVIQEADDDGEYGDDAGLVDPSVTGGGKGALKGRSGDLEKPAGKSRIKRKRKNEEPQEEDIDE